MTEQRELEILSAYLSNMKIVDIVQEYKVSSATVAKILKKYDIKTRYKGKENSDKNIYTEIQILGRTIPEIAVKHSMTEKEVRQIYKRERDKNIVKDYKACMGFDEICQKYDLSNMAVYKILDKNKVERRQPYKRSNTSKTLLTENQQKMLIYDYENTEMTVNSLIQKYGISKYQFYSTIYAFGAKPRGTTSFSAKDRTDIKNKSKNGATKTELAYEYRTSREKISNILKEP